MTIQDILTLITNAFAEYGTYVLQILALFLGIGIAYLVFKFGKHKVETVIAPSGIRPNFKKMLDMDMSESDFNKFDKSLSREEREYLDNNF